MTARLAPVPPDEWTDEQRELLTAVSGGGEVLNIFATLARHPELMKAWSRFGGRLLFRGALPARDRELLILRTAYRCGTAYEWGHHVVIGRGAGISEEEVAGIGEGAAAETWSDHDRLLLTAADELHDHARLSDATWEALRAVYDDQQLIEVPMVVGQYHLVAFTLNSLGVEPEPGLPPLPA